MSDDEIETRANELAGEIYLLAQTRREEKAVDALAEFGRQCRDAGRRAGLQETAKHLRESAQRWFEMVQPTHLALRAVANVLFDNAAALNALAGEEKP